jgi:uncharacterized protein YndB with AHSA1/START domain
MKATVTKTVSATVEAVWAVVSNHEGMTGWAPGLKASLVSEGTPDRNGVGAVRRLRNPFPVPAIVEEITAFEPNRRLAYRALSGVPLKNYAGEIVLESADGGTTITYSISADPRLPGIDAALVRGIAIALLNTVVRQIRKGT